MAWKDLQTWLKGGIIALLIGLFSSVLYIIVGPLFNGFLSRIIYMIFILPFELVLFPLFSSNVKNLFFDMEACFFGCNPKFLGYVAIILAYFLIGALIGWIVGKIKSSKK
jgi:hypothetical protein